MEIRRSDRNARYASEEGKFVELGVMGCRRENGQRWRRQHVALPSSNVRSYPVECRSPGELHAPLKVRGMLKCEQRSSVTLYARSKGLFGNRVVPNQILV